jgi:hypothetical protein
MSQNDLHDIYPAKTSTASSSIWGAVSRIAVVALTLGATLDRLACRGFACGKVAVAAGAKSVRHTS